jgi:thiol-disulfide isomerase/thioredoxin
MSRKFLCLAIAAVLLAACHDNSVEITGILEYPQKGEYIFLDELKSNELLAVDSVMVSADGRFDFKRGIKSPSFYLLKINQNNFLTMLLEPGQKIKLTSHNDSLNYPVTVTGSEGTMLMAGYNHTLRKAITRISGLSAIYDQNAGNPGLLAIVDSLDRLGQGYLNDINKFTKDYIDRNLSSLVSLVALYQQVAPKVYVLNPKKDFSYFVKVDSSLFPRYPHYEPVETLHRQVEELKMVYRDNPSSAVATGENMVAPEIALPSPEGDTIRLSSTRGSIVLLDFWASWCGPCRAENPNLVEAYKKYHYRGFQIFQVSLDKTREAWLKGIKDDRLDKWIHVSDVKYWKSEVVPMYNIEAIPSNFLLDKEGRIIASNLRGGALDRKLEELFK